MPYSNHANVQHDVNGICECIKCVEQLEVDSSKDPGFAEFVFLSHNPEDHEPTFEREPYNIIHLSGHISAEDKKYMKIADDFDRINDGKGNI